MSKPHLAQSADWIVDCCGSAACGIKRRFERAGPGEKPGPARHADGETDPFMLQFFRKFFKSKAGVGFTLVFLVVIAIAFGTSDVASNRAFGGVSGGDRVAVVGNRRIDASELTASAGNMFDQMRQQNPTLTMQVLVAQGGF